MATNIAESTETEMTHISLDIKERLKYEHELLGPAEKYPILCKDGKTCFEEQVRLNGILGERIYKLRVYLNDEDFNIVPDLVVCESPEPMPNGPDWNGSHDTIHGYLRICHWNPVAWSKKYLIFHVSLQTKRRIIQYLGLNEERSRSNI